MPKRVEREVKNGSTSSTSKSSIDMPPASFRDNETKPWKPWITYEQLFWVLFGPVSVSDS